MIKQGKVWGTTAPLFEKNNVELHEIYIKQGGYCSKHKHEHKYNQFYVMRGKLQVTIWQEYTGGLLEDVTIIEDGESCIVPPNAYHRFEALSDVHALELYYVELSKRDIKRADQGGLVDHAKTTKVSTIESAAGSERKEGYDPTKSYLFDPLNCS